MLFPDLPLRTISVALGLSVAACGSDPSDPDPDPDPDPNGEADLVLTEVVGGLGGLTTLTAPPDDPRIFVTEQAGRIRVIEDGSLVDAPFLDLTDRTAAEGERGLLGLAFHPDYAANGRFFVNYTDLTGDTRIVEYRVSDDDPDRADPASAVELLSIEQPFSNHNGGDLEFGPDGMLYVSSGDGGSGGDPEGNGQNTSTLLGGLLRLDVSTPGEAAVPPDNPFAGEPDQGAGELWAWGLRNPWRFSFDPVTDLLYIADVGQDDWEEVDVAPASDPGLNYGWAIMEGPECFGGGECDRTGLEESAVSYPSSEGCSVIGGAVYRGDRVAGVAGHYFYSDLCSRFLRSFRYDDGEVVDEREWDVEAPAGVSSMGRDADGELYLLTVDGRVLRVDPADDG